MMRQQSSGITPQKTLLVVCGVSMMMNVGFLLNTNVSTASCANQLRQCERNFQDVSDHLSKARSELEAKRETVQDASSDHSKQCPPCNCNSAESGDEVKEEGGAASAVSKDSPPWAWLKGRERVGRGVWKTKIYKTDNTYYDPAEDAKLQQQLPGDKNAYARSPVPMGSARIRVGPKKWITLDEVAFAHDVFFEEWQRFSFINWLGVKCQQDPMDAFAIQDMLWRVKPDLIIEVGTNNGGGAIFYASIMQNYNKNGKIVTLDVKPVTQNWMTGPNAGNCEGCITGNEHPLWKDSDMINFIKGDIMKKDIQAQVEEFVNKAKTVLVVEDASHRYPETLHRMNVIYKYVTVGSYMLVQDTKMDRFVSRLRKKYGGLKFGPMRSVDEFIKANQNWEIDRTFEYYIYSQHHRGFLKKTSN
eukprot:TRINITY_DN58361_c0_g1_i1.p1 TRINITY_DN58361_c0_g1~~TRINITY_DN58361_c0_g1_i1.p1  ORF type:complete len:435 (+),score=163.50 TRINITY_DN58361_c0_g1_i1:60-1307(+)